MSGAFEMSSFLIRWSSSSEIPSFCRLKNQVEKSFCCIFLRFVFVNVETKAPKLLVSKLLWFARRVVWRKKQSLSALPCAYITFKHFRVGNWSPPEPQLAGDSVEAGLTDDRFQTLPGFGVLVVFGDAQTHPFFWFWLEPPTAVTFYDLHISRNHHFMVFCALNSELRKVCELSKLMTIYYVSRSLNKPGIFIDHLM